MNHYASPAFWSAYETLPESAQRVADRAFEILKSDPRHPSLHFKRIGRYWSARAGIHYRALAIEIDDGFLWFWIGTHADYDKLLNA